MRKTKKNKGFTLIEILVVIGLIALLAAIVLIAINPARQFAQARDAQRTNGVNAILNAVGQYTADNKGNLPSEINSLTVDVKTAISEAGADLCSVLVPTYISALAIDPKTGTDPKTDKDDSQISKGECDDGYVTGFKVSKDTDGRITIYASGEVPSGTDNIQITR